MPKHHFIPQTYLRGFATDDDPERVYFYDKRMVNGPAKRMIEDVCHQNNLYEVLMDEGVLKSDLEDAFANVAEPAFRAIVDKLLGGKPLTDPEKSEFAAYVALQIMRTPASRELYSSMLAEMWDRESKKHWRELLDDETRVQVMKETSEKLGVDLSSITKEHIQGIIDGTKFTTKWTIPKENWIKQAVENMEVIFRMFERMHWRIYFAPNGSAFITSDNPVGVLLSMSDGSWMIGSGYLAPHAIRFFPLSKRACLAIQDDEASGFSFTNATKKLVKKINHVTALSHHNILISHDASLLNRSIKRVPEGFNLIDAVKQHAADQIRAGKYD